MIAALLLAFAAAADSLHGSVVTDTLWAQALGTKKAVVVYLPPSYATSPARRYPVAYYLHGAYGRETDWTQHGHIDAVMDSLIAAGAPEMIIVMPDGDDGMYTTWNVLVTIDACRKTKIPSGEPAATYCVPWQHYDDYIARDVVQYADKKFRTQADRRHRGIAGLSMGGYGAVSLSLEYPELFAAAASHSGLLAPLYSGPKQFDGHPQWYADGVSAERGWGSLAFLFTNAFGRDTSAWWARDPGRRLAQLRLRRGAGVLPALFVDVGTDDFTVGEARVFRWEAQQIGVPVEYHEWPGDHNWIYWHAHVTESLRWLGAQIAK